jgi:hypothetical protein
VNEQLPDADPPAVAILRDAEQLTVRRSVAPLLFVTVVVIDTVPVKPSEVAGRPDAVSVSERVSPGLLVIVELGLVARLTPVT